MSSERIDEARRQVEICNACRYCEGYCSVFPAISRQRAFTEADIVQLANLCHNCRGCYYACQYVEPHEFALNIPQALAEVRHESWKTHAWPQGLARLFDHSGGALALGLVAGFALILALTQALRPASGEGFYAFMSHGLMVAVFTPAFLAPLAATAFSIRSYWRGVGGGSVTLSDVAAAFRSAGAMRELSGGHGEGCNFEDEDRFTSARRHAHRAILYGFLLCFAATATGTVLHYGFDLPAPYGFFSLPKMLGLPGGLLLTAGTAYLAWLKTRADPDLGARGAWGGEMAFVLLLLLVSASGLALYAATGSDAVGLLLPLHLGAVLAFFVLTPYSKMAHGFYRLAALTLDAAAKRPRGAASPGSVAARG